MPTQGLSFTALVSLLAYTASTASALGATSPAAPIVAPAFAVTYIEVRAAAIAHTALLLHRYALAERAAAGSERSARAVRVEVLQEIARPERWVLLERADDQTALAGAEAKVADRMQPLQELSVAPPDRHDNHEFAVPDPVPALDAPDARSRAAAIYAVTHLDIGIGNPPDLATVGAAIRQLTGEARASSGNLQAGVWQQNGHANHFAMVLVWARRADLDAFENGSSVREYRDRIARFLGSPYDERFYQRRD